MGSPWAISVLLCAVLLFAPVSRPAAAADEPAGKRAALVNGALITGQAFENEVQRLKRRDLKDQNPASAVNRKQVLENLIVRELLYQEALRLGFKAPAGAVAAKLDELGGRFSDPKAMKSTLDGMGLSSSALETQLERGLVVERYLEETFSRETKVSDAEVLNYYEDHPDQFKDPLRLRLSHILIKTDPAWDPSRKEQAHVRISLLAKRLSEGEDFAALAREASDCQSAPKGGDLGYFLPGQLAKKMEHEARLLKPGEVSEVVEDSYGLHLLKLTELRQTGVLPLEQVQGKIRARLKEEKTLKALAPVVKRIRAEAKVELLLNENEK